MSESKVIEKPILFSAPMVRAILEGRKTQTRRVVKSKGPLNEFDMAVLREDGKAEFFHTPQSIFCTIKCPHPVGSRMWVRETWRDCGDGIVVYRATKTSNLEGTGQCEDPYNVKWKPSIFMPRWASRIMLEVTEVRVQRLQEISEVDAIAEGIERLYDSQELAAASPKMRAMYEAANNGWRNYLWHGHFGRNGMGNKLSDAWPHQFSNYESAVGSFSSLWESINGPDSWRANPWVWAYTFKVVEP